MRLILIITLLSLIESCKYELNEKDLQWNPYKKGDKLTFISNEGYVDTITITEIENYTQAKNNIQKVMCEYSPDKRTNSLKSSTFFLALTAIKDNSVLSLNFPMGNGKFIPYITKRISQMDSTPKSTYILDSIKLNDLVSLSPTLGSRMVDRSSNVTFVTSIQWSKSNGLISYHTNNNTHWKLKAKYRL